MLFMMALSVSSNFNCFCEDRWLRFFSEERARRKERKRGYTFARFLFNATWPHKRLANYFFFMAAVCSGTMYT